MGVQGKEPPVAEGEQSKQYLVDCEVCPFEQMAEGRDKAKQVGTHHRLETGHELVAVEFPRSIGRSQL